MPWAGKTETKAVEIEGQWDGWKVKQLPVRLYCSKRKDFLLKLVYMRHRQPFGIHKSLEEGPTKFSLCHVPTGYKLCSLISEDDCRQLADVLAETVGDLFETRNVAAIRINVPEEIKRWLYRCNKTGKLEDLV